MKKSSDDQKDIEKTKAIMSKLASMPHEPHVKKGNSKKDKGKTGK